MIAGGPSGQLPGPGVPVGAPDWVTAELVAETLETWEPHYGRRLTDAEAVDILRAVGDLADLMQGQHP